MTLYMTTSVGINELILEDFLLKDYLMVHGRDAFFPPIILYFESTASSNMYECRHHGINDLEKLA